MITVQQVHSSPVPVTEALSARIVCDDNATARISTGFSGRLIAIPVAPGDSVHKGQTLAEFDSPDFGNALSDLEKAQADERRKAIVYERAQQLVPGESISTRECESAGSDLEQARAETARAMQRVRYLNPARSAPRGEQLRLISPLDGVVTERVATLGQEVQPGASAPLFVVADLRRLWLVIDLPERLLGLATPGALISVERDAYPGEHFQARLLKPGRLVDPNTRRVTLRAALDNPKLRLLPEMFVTAHILQSGGTGTPVPNAALVTEGAKTYVYVQRAPGEFRRQQVQLLAQGPDLSFVGEGLSGSERVVTNGALLIDAEREGRSTTS